MFRISSRNLTHYNASFRSTFVFKEDILWKWNANRFVLLVHDVTNVTTNQSKNAKCLHQIIMETRQFEARDITERHHCVSNDTVILEERAACVCLSSSSSFSRRSLVCRTPISARIYIGIAQLSPSCLFHHSLPCHEKIRKSHYATAQHFHMLLFNGYTTNLFTKVKLPR